MARPKRRARFQVFISHSSLDRWIARQIAHHIERRGAGFFLDATHIESGDDFEDRISEAAAGSQELLILLTPRSVERPYLWVELGLFWETDKRIVTVCSGWTAAEVVADPRIPIRLKRSHLIELNDLDSYLEGLAIRLKSSRTAHGQ
jgi:hypothetical protein